MFEDTKVQRLLVRLKTPGYGMTGGDLNPPNKIGLRTSVSVAVAGYRSTALTLLWISSCSMPAIAQGVPAARTGRGSKAE